MYVRRGEPDDDGAADAFFEGVAVQRLHDLGETDGVGPQQGLDGVRVVEPRERRRHRDPGPGPQHLDLAHVGEVPPPCLGLGLADENHEADVGIRVLHRGRVLGTRARPW